MTTEADGPIHFLRPAIVPNGQYDGVWGGYQVKFECNGFPYGFRTKDGIRTPAAPCVVTVCFDKVTVEVKKRAAT